MASEITVVSSLKCVNGNLNIPKMGGTSQAITQTNRGGGGPGFVKISTAGEDLVISDLTTPGLAYFKNVDPTNYIEIGIFDSTTFFPIIKLLPGEEYVIRLAALGSNTLRARANTAIAELYAVILET